MTSATRAALEQVSAILHRAGWDAESTPPQLTEQSMQTMRAAYVLRDDDLAIVRETFGKGQRVEDAARAIGKEPEDAKALLSEALARLVEFAGVAEKQGFAGARP